MTVLLAFAAAVAVVVLVGPRMARVADRLGEATGMGGALFGAVFLALATDLPELALTTSAGITGSPKIAVGGLLGSAAAQLVFIAAVDMSLRDGRLYRDVSVRTTLGQCALMAAVLTVPVLFAAANPTFGWVGIGTIVLPAVYIGGLLAIRGIGPDTEEAPTPETDVPPDDEDTREPTAPLWRRFGGFALILAAAGVVLERTTESIGADIGLGETAAGALLAGVATSLPELVTATAAARAGALELAVGNIVGSSALDVALLSLADAFYTEGSFLELLGPPEFTLIGVAMGLTVLLLVGLARREPVGLPRVGPESYLMLGVYVTGVLLLITASS